MPEGARPDPPNRSVKLTFTGYVGPQTWSNVMWLFLTGSGEIDHSTLIELANDCYGVYSEEFCPVMSNGGGLDRAQVVLWFDGEEFSAFSTAVSVPGSIGGTCLPANVAMCISWPLAQHYRGGHPRTYLAAMPTSYLANTSHWLGDAHSEVQDAARAFHTSIEGLGPYDGIATVQHGIVSFVLDKEWRDPPVFRRIQEDATVDGRIDTQRRRLGRDIS